MNDLVSVIIPTFNRSKSLKRAIDSIFLQTYRNWEIIVVDNSSSDDTCDMLKKYNSEKIRFFIVKNQGVIGFSRNVGIEKSKGKFVAFLDSDDWWECSKLTSAIRVLNDQHTDVLFHDCMITSEKSSFISRCRKLGGNVLKDLVINGNTLITSSVVVKRSALLNVGCFSEDHEVVGWEDYHLWLKLAKKEYRFNKLSGNYGYYWQGEENFDSPKRVLKNLIKIEEYLISEYSLIANEYNIWWLNYTRGRSFIKLNDQTNAKFFFTCVLFDKTPIKFKLKSLLWWLYITYLQLKST
jgi:glycosyltransferase involved in cell wall biosynthesis